MRQLLESPNQVLLTFEVCIDFTFLIELIVIVSSEIFENNTILRM